MSYGSRDEEIAKGFQGIQHRYKALKHELDEYNQKYEQDKIAIQQLKVRHYKAIQQQRGVQERMSEITEKLPKIMNKIKYYEDRIFEAERRDLENQDFSYKLQTILKEDVQAAERELKTTKDGKIDTAMKLKKISFETEKMELKLQKAEKRKAKAEENVYVLEQRLEALFRAMKDCRQFYITDNVNEVSEQQIEGMKIAIGRQRERCRMAENKIDRLYTELEEKDKHLKFARRRNMELQLAKRDLLSSKLY